MSLLNKPKMKIIEFEAMALCGKIYIDEIGIPPNTTSEKLYIMKEIAPAILLNIIKPNDDEKRN